MPVISLRFIVNPTDFKQKVVILINGVQKEVDLFRTSKEFEVGISRELQVPLFINYLILFPFSSVHISYFHYYRIGLTLINIQQSGEKNGKGQCGTFRPSAFSDLPVHC